MKRIIIFMLAFVLATVICPVSANAMNSDVKVEVFDSVQEFCEMFKSEAGAGRLSVVKSVDESGTVVFYVVMNNDIDVEIAENTNRIVLPPREGNESSLDVIDPVFD